MMQFTKSEDICLSHKALPLWVSLLSSAERAQRGQQGEFTLPLEVAAALMDLAGVDVLLPYLCQSGANNSFRSQL